MQPWNTIRAACFGGLIGLAAGAFKSFAPKLLGTNLLGTWLAAATGPAIAKELVTAMFAFALLCGVAAALRMRRLLGAEIERR
jgi:hypothetical protein